VPRLRDMAADTEIASSSVRGYTRAVETLLKNTRACLYHNLITPLFDVLTIPPSHFE